MFAAGDHVPLMLLLDVVGSVNDVPEQSGPGFVKAGVTCGFTVTVIVAVVAHCPAVGVNV